MTSPGIEEQHDPAAIGPYQIHRILVAHDGSPAAEEALRDSVALAECFGAELLLARVEKPLEGLPGMEFEREMLQAHSDLEVISRGLMTNGLKVRVVLRVGSVGDVLFALAGDESADLLMLGAYGRGEQDRRTLGSTAELLLRALPCPAMTYGPHASSGLLERMKEGPELLLAVNLPCDPASLMPAVAIARLFENGLDLLHVCSAEYPEWESKARGMCEELAYAIEKAGVRSSWSVMVGVPDTTICLRAHTQGSPMILFPLKRSNRLFSITSDNVAAKVIREAAVPIMTWRVD